MPIPASLPPEPDIAALATAARRDLAELPGCYQMQGQVLEDVGLGALGHDRETHRFLARLDKGWWSDLQVETLDLGKEGVQSGTEAGGVKLPFFPPIFGRLQAAEDAAPADAELGSGGEGGLPGLAGLLLQRLDQQLQTPVTVESVGTEEFEGRAFYRLEELVETGVAGRARTRPVQFDVLVDPETGRARRWVGSLNGQLHLDGYRVRDLRLELEVDALGRPRRERLQGVWGVGIWALNVDQQIDYSVLAPCEG